MRLLIPLTLGLLTSSAFPAAEDQPEPGFTLLFNGKSLDGWKAKPGESLEAKTEAFKGRFKVADGMLVIDPAVKGDVIIETTRELTKDVHLKFDFFPGPDCNNDLFFRGLKFDLKKPDVKNLKDGEWNSFEIIVKNGQAEFRCNGESLKTEKVKNESSALGIRAEIGPVKIRRLRAKTM